MPSAIRMMTASTQPRAKPASAPSVVPSTSESPAASSPTASEI